VLSKEAGKLALVYVDRMEVKLTMTFTSRDMTRIALMLVEQIGSVCPSGASIILRKKLRLPPH